MKFKWLLPLCGFKGTFLFSIFKNCEMWNSVTFYSPGKIVWMVPPAVCSRIWPLTSEDSLHVHIGVLRSWKSASVHHLVLERNGWSSVKRSGFSRLLSQAAMWPVSQQKSLPAFLILRFHFLTMTCWKSAFIPGCDCSCLMKIKFHNVNIFFKNDFFIAHKSTPEWNVNKFTFSIS